MVKWEVLGAEVMLVSMKPHGNVGLAQNAKGRKKSAAACRMGWKCAVTTISTSWQGLSETCQQRKSTYGTSFTPFQCGETSGREERDVGKKQSRQGRWSIFKKQNGSERQLLCSLRIRWREGGSPTDLASLCSLCRPSPAGLVLLTTSYKPPGRGGQNVEARWLWVWSREHQSENYLPWECAVYSVARSNPRTHRLSVSQTFPNSPRPPSHQRLILPSCMPAGKSFKMVAGMQLLCIRIQMGKPHWADIQSKAGGEL